MAHRLHYGFCHRTHPFLRFCQLLDPLAFKSIFQRKRCHWLRRRRSFRRSIDAIVFQRVGFSAGNGHLLRFICRYEQNQCLAKREVFLVSGCFVGFDFFYHHPHFHWPRGQTGHQCFFSNPWHQDPSRGVFITQKEVTKWLNSSQIFSLS